MLRGGEGVLIVVHSRSVTSIDACIPEMSERNTPCLHRPRSYCLHQARSAVVCSASRMAGELHPTKNRL